MLLRFVLRNLKNRLFLNCIKVVGLALALSGIIFIAAFVKNELSYDSYHQKADQIYRFTITDPYLLNNSHFARMIYSEQIPGLAKYFPEIESYIRLAPIRGGAIVYNQKYYNINEAFICDSTFFDVFDAEIAIGDKNTILDAPASMIITESFAKKVFGNLSPVGQTLTLPAGQYYSESSDFTIKGIMKDFPQNSHFHPDIITTPAYGKIEGWAWAYLQLVPNTNPEKITSGYPAFLARQLNKPVDEIQTKAYLQKLTDIHLHSDKLREIEANGNTANLIVLALAALVLLLISMSNYASLNWGMSGFSNKFIAINQVLGSNRFTNLKFFFIESLIIITSSVLISLLIILPVNTLIHEVFQLDLLKNNWPFSIELIILFCLLGLLSGIQPVFAKSLAKTGMNSLTKRSSESGNLTISKTITVVQYAFAIILIIAVFTISRQTRFALANSLGVPEGNIICFESVNMDIQKKFEVFKQELLKQGGIESVTAMMDEPGGEANDMFSFELEGHKKTDDQQQDYIGIMPCDYSFARLFNLKFLSGHNYSEQFTDNEGSGEYIINETALHYLGYSDPNNIIGKRFKLNTNIGGIELPAGTIIGVVNDFHLSSLKKKVSPMVLFKRKDIWLINLLVAYNPEKKQEALSNIQKVWEGMFPNYPFQYDNVGSIYQKVYKTELLQARLLSVFTIIAIFICSMGILGLSLLITSQRTKEIGIRKVNGAKLSEILFLINRDFIQWVIIAFVFAIPVAWLIMRKWLEAYAYKINLSWWIFALSGIIALGIALLTVSWQSWRAATRNPVEALRYE